MFNAVLLCYILILWYILYNDIYIFNNICYIKLILWNEFIFNIVFDVKLGNFNFYNTEKQ